MTIAAITPNRKLSVIDDTTAAMNAPVRSWPSMAMFVIPTRSLMIPAIAPRMIGTAKTKAVPAINAIGTDFSAASQPSSAVTPTRPNTIETQIGVFRFFMALESENPASANIANPARTPSRLESISNVGS